MEFVFENDNDSIDASAEVLDPINNSYGRSTSSRRTSRRNVPTNFADIEFNEPVKRTRKRATAPKVSYVKSLKKKRRSTSQRQPFSWTWSKFGWLMCAGLVIRLFSMESGVLDYHRMNQTLDQKALDLVSLRQDNADLIQEIHKIKTSPSYQKKLARNHLGVIAKDEYLVLFSNDSAKLRPLL